MSQCKLVRESKELAVSLIAFSKAFVGFGGREGGEGLAGLEVMDVGPLAVKGLLSADGTRERLPSGEGERDFNSSGCATTDRVS